MAQVFLRGSNKSEGLARGDFPGPDYKLGWFYLTAPRTHTISQRHHGGKSQVEIVEVPTPHLDPR